MDAAGLSPTKLGETSGLGASYVGRFMSGSRGKRPTAQTLLKLAIGLNVSYEWLATGKGSPREPSPDPALVPDAQPNRVAVYASAAFRDAPTPLKQWFVSRRAKPDLETHEWRLALDYGAKLHELRLLDSAPRGRRGFKKTDQG